MSWTDDVEKKIVELTAQEIQKAVQRHIVPERISIVIAGDFEE